MDYGPDQSNLHFEDFIGQRETQFLPEIKNRLRFQMAIHLLEEKQVIKTDLETCWKFFSSAKNLPVITPPDLGFEILSSLPEEVYPGLFITYRVRPLWGMPLTWVTEITHVRAPHFFCDEQRVGPYRIWHHEHEFKELPNGRVEIWDRVHYQLPMTPFSELVHPVLVQPKLREIFAFRRQKLEKLFPE